jgi:hypothetical protein
VDADLLSAGHIPRQVIPYHPGILMIDTQSAQCMFKDTPVGFTGTEFTFHYNAIEKRLQFKPSDLAPLHIRRTVCHQGQHYIILPEVLQRIYGSRERLHVPLYFIPICFG